MTLPWSVIIALAGIAGIFALCFFIDWKSRQPLSPREKERQRREIEEQEAFRRSRPWANDPIGHSIEWTALPGAGALGIHGVEDSRIEFRVRRPGALHFVILLMAVGGAIAIYSTGSIKQAVIALLAGIGINSFVWLVFRLANQPVAFDKRLGTFWKGREQFGQSDAQGSDRCQGRIADIHALQAFSTYRIVTKPNGFSQTYNTYQLNLVMKDGARLVVCGNDDGASLLKDARILSEFLGKPLWDAV